MLAAVSLTLLAAADVHLDGAVTAQAFAQSALSGDAAGGLLHARLDVERTFSASFFVKAEVSVAVLAQPTGLLARDLGSFVTVGVLRRGFLKRASLELAPLGAPARLPSFDWANAWGSARAAQTLIAPSVTAEALTDMGLLWVSLRGQLRTNSLNNLTELRPDVIGGVDLPISASLRLEVRAAYLQYGLVPSLAFQGQTLDSHAVGAAARLSWTWNEPVLPPVDFVAYGSDPTRFARFFETEPRVAPMALWLGLEGGAASQVLSDGDHFGASKTQPMGWVDLQARLRLGELRLFGLLRVQSTSLAVFDTPGVIPFTAFLDGSPLTPMVAGQVGADFRVRALHLTPGVLVRLRQPATVSSVSFSVGGLPTAGRTLEILGFNQYAVLSADIPPAPILNLKASLRFDVGRSVALLADVDAEKNFSQVTYVDQTSGVSIPTRDERWSVGVALIGQARF